jgi:predicted nucleic acid-binding protein
MYLDSSIIVKLLVDEPETRTLVTALVGLPLSSCELAIPEVRSALFGKEREKRISKAQREAAWQLFRERVRSEEIELYPLNSTTLSKAAQVMERCHPTVALRTLDAIHAAACDLSQDFPLCTADKRMRDAAGVLGIPLFPTDESPNP